MDLSDNELMAERCADLVAGVQYDTQLLALRVGDQRMVLAPGRAPNSAPFPFQRPVWIISAWNPQGHRRTYAENVGHGHELQQALDDVCATVVGAGTAVAHNRAWVEDVLVATDIEPADAVRLGEQFGQSAVVRWASQTLSVYPTRRFFALRATTQGWALRPALGACPMRMDDQGVCSPRGGISPVRAAIHARVIWSAHRFLLTTRLGCGMCDNGMRTVGGPPLGPPAHHIKDPHPELQLASRFGGYSFRQR